MRMRTPILAGALSLVYAVPAAACTFYSTATYLDIPAGGVTWGLGAAFTFTDPTTTAISGDASMRLGNNMVVRPGIGLCSANDESDPFFGADIGYQLTQSGSMRLNLQSGITYLSFDGGSLMNIPIGAAASFAGSGTMGFYAGGSLVWTNLEVDGGGSASDTNPMLFGGIGSRSGSMGWKLGGQLLLGDDTEFGVVAGVSFGGASSALRNFAKSIK
jgi:hypothetical protein